MSPNAFTCRSGRRPTVIHICDIFRTFHPFQKRKFLFSFRHRSFKITSLLIKLLYHNVSHYPTSVITFNEPVYPSINCSYHTTFHKKKYKKQKSFRFFFFWHNCNILRRKSYIPDSDSRTIMIKKITRWCGKC